MGALIEELDALAREGRFSGVLRLDEGDATLLVRAYGAADRRHGIANTVATRFAMASATKALTALTVVGLVERGVIDLAATARSLLGDDLPLIDDRVTIEHLLGHRSGIGDYLDEELQGDIGDHVLPVPVHELATTESYLRVLGGHPTAFAPDTAFAYCNGGYAVLALLAERAAGEPFPELVARLVCDPAAMRHTGFLRSDELPGGTATGYLDADGLRTNVLHLPVRGTGDGGAYTTVDDVHALWAAVFAGRVVASASLAAMVRPRSTSTSGRARYGLGFWLAAAGDAVQLEGYDAGVSFRSVHQPSSRRTCTVIANTSEGAWPLARLLDERFVADP